MAWSWSQPTVFVKSLQFATCCCFWPYQIADHFKRLSIKESMLNNAKYDGLSHPSCSYCLLSPKPCSFAVTAVELKPVVLAYNCVSCCWDAFCCLVSKFGILSVAAMAVDLKLSVSPSSQSTSSDGSWDANGVATAIVVATGCWRRYCCRCSGGRIWRELYLTLLMWRR